MNGVDQKAIWDGRYSSSSDNPRNDGWIENYIKYFNEKRENLIVDLGCGKGANSIYLQERGFNVLACDFSSQAINFVNKTYPAVQTQCFDMIYEFPNDIKDIGIILASLSTHYFTLDETVRLYNNIRNSLETGGYFIFRVNSKKEYEYKDKIEVADIIENDYYILKNGVKKRYFDINSISGLLNGFIVMKINEGSSEFYNNKNYIEGIAKKI